MKKNTLGTSIIEAMVVLLIVVTGITGVYSLLISSQRLANSTQMRIEAIQIARNGLESFTNIRDTNWLLFAADHDNCWNVWNYDSSCIGNSSTTLDIRHGGNASFIIYKNSNNQFELDRQTHGGNDFSNTTYRTRFWISKDSRGFYTQSGWTLYSNNTTDPLYTREIRLDYIDVANVSQWSNASNNPKVKVTSIVQWSDPAQSNPEKLELSTILSNWKIQN